MRTHGNFASIGKIEVMMLESTYKYISMLECVKYNNNARREVEYCFRGLSPAPGYLAILLSTRANPITGTVENITYRELALLLTVDAASGRKDSGVPQKHTIRSYLRTIETQCSEHFKIISDGQSLKIQFLTLPAIYASHFNCEEVYTPVSTNQSTHETLINTGLNASNNTEINTEEYTDLYTPEGAQVINAHAIKPNQIKPNNNNPVSDESADVKKPISGDFYPSQFVIDKALSLGFSRVTDAEELSKFILFNRASGSLWRNYDYVYLMWIEAAAAREQAEKAKEQQPKTQPAYSRSDLNDKRNARQTPTERVIAVCSEGSDLEFCQQTRRFTQRGAPEQKPVPVRYMDIHSLGPIN